MISELKKYFGIGITRYTVWILLGLLILIGVSVSDSFLTLRNIMNVLAGTAPIAMMIYGMAFLLMLGRIDLSLESTYAVAPLIALLTVVRWFPFLPPVLAILLTILVGIGIGAFNGYCSVKLGVSDFLIGLAMMLFLRGLALFLIPEGLYNLPGSYLFWGNKRFFGTSLPLSVLILFGIFVILFVLLHTSPYGRKVLAIGSNKKAAFIAGVDADKIEIFNFIIAGGMASVGGLLAVGRTMAVTNTMGDGVIISVLAAVVLGGIGLEGGTGRLTGALGGAIFIKTLGNVLTLGGVNPFLLQAIFGLVLLFAIILQSQRENIHKYLVLEQE